MLFTTLKLCKENNACAEGYIKLKKSLPENHKDTDHIALTHIVKTNGLGDAIWALRATTEPCRDFITEYAVWCAEQVLDIYEKEYPNDKRVRECVEGIRKYQKGQISKKDLIDLSAAARYAARSAYAAADAAADADAACAAARSAYAAADAYELKVKTKLIEMLIDHKEK